MKIKLPGVFYLDGIFVVESKDSFDLGKVKIKNDIFSQASNLVRKQKSGWILDREGNFYTLEAIGKEREWTKNPLWNFVRSRYKIIGPDKITISSMLKKMHEMPQKTPYKDLREDFIRHLETYDKDTILSKKVLDEWPIE